MDEVMDLDPEIDASTDVDLEAEPIETEGAEPAESTEQEPQQTTDQPDSPYTTKFSREMRAALKAWETANPESARFAKQARDNHARLFALTQLEPKGIDGVREKYALLNSLAVGDSKGIEAVTAMQERLAGVEEVDEMLASGNPKAFDALGPDFDAGLAKLAPAYLDRVKASDPAAYEAAILPHFVSQLAQSDLVREYNALVDVLNAQDDPRFDDATKMKFAISQLTKMERWMNGLAGKVGEIKPNGQVNTQQSELEQQRTELERERQQIHWDTKIKPLALQYENQTFNSLLDPYQKRLRLDDGAKADLLQAFKNGLENAGLRDKEYMRQMKIYQGQRNPDPNAVANYVKNAINKHSKTVLEGLVKARYGSFLAGKPQTQVKVTTNNGKPAGPVEPNVEIRTVKPPMSEIDHQRTPIEWLAQKKYRLYSGKIIQVRPQA
jgi:hypothetical protein